MILPGAAASSIAAAAQRLHAGDLVGIPTETVYGLAADADNDAAVAKIFHAKGRPSDHPLSVLVASASCVAHFAAEVPDFAARLIEVFWPGPLTLILPRRVGVATAAAAAQNSIGLRCPAHPVTLALLNNGGQNNGGQIPINFSPEKLAEKQLESDPHFFGLAAPSANLFGRVSPTTAQHVQEEFGDALLILDGGACTVGIESTIIDCTRGTPVLLRPGAITPERISAACGLPVLNNECATTKQPAPKAPRSLESHYAPRARVRLLPASALQAALDATDKAALRSVAIYSRTPLSGAANALIAKRMPDDAPAAACELFAVMRALDVPAVKSIWVEAPPAAPAWDGLRDRLQRSAAAPDSPG